MIIQEDAEFIKGDGSIRKLSDIIDENKDLVRNAQFQGLTTVADFNPGSVNYGFIVIYSMLQFNQEMMAETNDENFRLNDAIGDALDEIGYQKGVYREDPSFSTTNVIFNLPNPLESPFTILEGTEISTDDLVIFTTIEDLKILRGESTGVVEVICEEEGTIGNVKAGEINTIITPLGIDISVINEEDVTDGKDGEDDDNYRARIKDCWLNYQPRTALWFEKKAETIVKSAKYKKINNKQGKLIYKPQNDIREVDLVNYFNLKENDIVDHDLYFQEATPVTVIDENTTITVFLDNNYVPEIVKDQIKNNIQNYINDIEIGDVFKSNCLLFMVESTEGVILVRIDELSDVDLTNEEYAVMGDLNIVEG